MIEEYGTLGEQVETAMALTVPYEPVLLSLRRPAHAEGRSADSDAPRSKGGNER